MICGFQWHDNPWLDGHLHECIAECGDLQNCTRGEVSYSEYKAMLAKYSEDEEVPF